ncbi:hypothetical protein COO60DRAFT_1697924 [Scenedesmus sp. NREL 46B-D3]|nr:hypothetical protein COO60DRAFT_1697924 [Scenedesmus sp. NREL 46B-D3]
MRALEQPLLAVQQVTGGMPALRYRPLMPEDFQALKAAHAALFPIDYDDAFFHKATNALDRIWSCAAFAAVGPYGEERLVGFITAKTVFLHECEVTVSHLQQQQQQQQKENQAMPSALVAAAAADRQHMGLLSPIVDHDQSLYILTLGVLEGFRGQGIASSLTQAACQRACETSMQEGLRDAAVAYKGVPCRPARKLAARADDMQAVLQGLGEVQPALPAMALCSAADPALAASVACRALFLHVIAYNTQAMALYTMQGFACVARLSRFYYISTGRQPDPSTQVYDAYLYVQYVGGAAGMATPWDMLSMAWSPQPQLHQYPAGGEFSDSSIMAGAAAAAAAAAAADTGRSSCDSVTGGLQQQQQPQQEPMGVEQQRQQHDGFSRPRHRQDSANFFGFAAGGGSNECVKQQQQQQQRLELLPPLQQQPLYPQHWHSHPQLQQRPGAQQQQQQQQRRLVASTEAGSNPSRGHYQQHSCQAAPDYVYVNR